VDCNSDDAGREEPVLDKTNAPELTTRMRKARMVYPVPAS
jgi:hypothetical protein